MSEFLDFIWFPNGTEGCFSPPECLAARNRLRRKAEKKKGTNFPSDVAQDIDSELRNKSCCRTCKAALRKGLRLARSKLRESIPRIFGLPNWPTLLAMKAAALE
ncbi:hypothetical protein B0H11DRAFT_1923626 [Mycena galericulata]|nr:hypothetical protein B0H11DRAFT_1923626 [Mycena galericulata]